MPTITKNELKQALSVLSDPDPLKWFKRQTENFQQEIALLIRTKSINAASVKIATKWQKEFSLNPPLGTIVGKLGTKGLSIKTEYGSLVVRNFRSDAKYLILFIENQAIVDKAVSNSPRNVRAAINLRQYSFENAIPYVYRLAVEQDYEQTLSA